jgi:hypothetical protein
MSNLEREIRKLLKHECRRQRAYLWGGYCVFTPVVLSKIYGDGLQIVFIGSIDQRPRFWLARIDSKTDMDFVVAEDIVNEIEEEFGRVPEEGYLSYREFCEIKKEDRIFFDHNNYKEYKEDCEYPRMDWHGGHWGTIKNFGL